jgi:hypothetical protein
MTMSKLKKLRRRPNNSIQSFQPTTPKTQTEARLSSATKRATLARNPQELLARGFPQEEDLKLYSVDDSLFYTLLLTSLIF